MQILRIWSGRGLYKSCVLIGYSYTKPKGQLPDYQSPVVLKEDHRSVEDFCNKLHRNLLKELKQ